MANLSGLLTDLGSGLGNFMNAIADPFINFIVYLGVGGAVVGIIYSIGKLISNGLHTKKV